MLEIKKIKQGGNVIWEPRAMITNPFRVVNNVASGANTCTLTKNGNAHSVNLEYSLNNSDWNVWNADSSGNRTVTIPANGNLYLRGDNPNGFCQDATDTDYYSLTCSNKYALAGELGSLVSPYESDTLPANAFRRFFAGSTTLYNAGYLRLSATKPGRQAYLHLFDGCTNLRYAPHVLPATNLINDNNSTGASYGYMFTNCSSLTRMPIIKATHFGNSSCYAMFDGCTSLVDQWASETPSVQTSEKISFTIADDGGQTATFHYMFRNCTSLVDASGIVATKTTDWNTAGLARMFYGCSALTSAPSITIGSMASGSNSNCHSMFYGCSSLVTLPNIRLNAVSLGYGAYKQMFQGCTSLTTAPEIKATSMSNGNNTDNGSLAYMFRDCSSLTYIKVNFTSWSNGDYTKNWTYGINTYGGFYCPTALPETKNSSDGTTTTNYIPYNWTKNANPQQLPNPTVNGVNITTTDLDIDLSMSGYSDVTYYITANAGTVPSDPTVSVYDYKVTGTGSNSTGRQHIVVNYPRYVKVLATKSGYLNSNVVTKQYNQS